MEEDDVMRRSLDVLVSKDVEQVELATIEYVWWRNHQRLHGELDLRTPIEVEDAYYADLESAQPAPAGQRNR